MLRDGEGVTQESFAIIGFPETFVLDRRGRIAAVRRGPVDDQFMREEGSAPAAGARVRRLAAVLAAARSR